MLSARQNYRIVLRELENLVDLDVAVELLSSLRISRRIVPAAIQGPKKSKIVVVAPHPDDEIIGPGGTLIAAKIRGAEIKIIYLFPVSTYGPDLGL